MFKKIIKRVAIFLVIIGSGCLVILLVLTVFRSFFFHQPKFNDTSPFLIGDTFEQASNIIEEQKESFRNQGPDWFSISIFGKGEDGQLARVLAQNAAKGGGWANLFLFPESRTKRWEKKYRLSPIVPRIQFQAIVLSYFKFTRVLFFSSDQRIAQVMYIEHRF